MASWCLEGSDFGSQEVNLTVSMWSFHQVWNYIKDVGGFVIVSNQNWIDILVRMQEVSIR